MVLYGAEKSNSTPPVPSQQPARASVERRDRRRVTISFWSAAALHSSLLLVPFATYKPLAKNPTLALISAGIAVSLQVSPRNPGVIPGGGSEQPDPNGALRAAPPEARAQAVKTMPAGRAINARAERSTVKTAELASNDSDAVRPAHDISGRDEADSLPSTGLHAGQFEDQSSVFASASDRHTPSISRFVGYGPGAYGGPGGPGAGFGSGKGTVTRDFTFGGKTGAFRGDVCFFEQRVSSLGQIRDCRPVATFYTSVLNVPARHFTEGFPGVSERVEWFAIRYRGKVKVTQAGTYKFRLISDDGSMLYIDGRRVINNDGQHAPRAQEGSLTLDVGEHILFVNYYQGPRENIALQLFVTPQNGSERLLTPTL